MKRNLGIVALLLYTAILAAAQPGQDWPVWCGDNGATKYSPLMQINKTNVASLEMAWRWMTGERPAGFGAHSWLPVTSSADGTRRS